MNWEPDSMNIRNTIQNKIIILFALLLFSACTKSLRNEVDVPSIPIESELNNFFRNFDSDVYRVEKEYEEQNTKQYSDTCKLVSSQAIASFVYYENCTAYDSISRIYFEKMKLVYHKYW